MHDQERPRSSEEQPELQALVVELKNRILERDDPDLMSAYGELTHKTSQAIDSELASAGFRSAIKTNLKIWHVFIGSTYPYVEESAPIDAKRIVCEKIRSAVDDFRREHDLG